MLKTPGFLKMICNLFKLKTQIGAYFCKESLNAVNTDSGKCIVYQAKRFRYLGINLRSAFLNEH